jgi:hypothetical protein
MIIDKIINKIHILKKFSILQKWSSIFVFSFIRNYKFLIPIFTVKRKREKWQEKDRLEIDESVWIETVKRG